MSSPRNLVLSGRYDLSALADLRTELLKGIEAEAGPLHLDLGAVEGGDVGLVQLVLSLEKTLAAAGHKLTVAASDAVGELFSRTGATLPGAPA